VRLAALVVIAALAQPARPVRADSFDPTDYDKIAHMTTSYGITLTVAVVARRYEIKRWQAVLLGAATALLLGTAKELAYDDEFSWGDQAANTIGAATAAGVVFTFRL
jgi:VanZ family protein